MLVALGRDNPGLDLMVTEIDPVAVPEALRSRRLDVALWHDYDVVPAPPDPGLESVPLLDEAVYLAAPAALDAADADPVAACVDALRSIVESLGDRDGCIEPSLSCTCCRYRPEVAGDGDASVECLGERHHGRAAG